MLTTLLSALFLLAIGQGVFLAGALLLLALREPAMRTGNALLAALLLLCATVIGHAWLGVNDLYERYPHSALAVMPLGLATGPLLYLYLRQVLSAAPLARRQALHFAPLLIAVLALMPFYLQPGASKLAWMHAHRGTPWLALAAGIKLAIFLAYIRVCYRMLATAGKTPLADGLRKLLSVWLVGGLLSVAALAMELADVDLPVSADAVGGLALLCFLYATAFLALRLPLGYRPLQPEAATRPRYGDKLLSDDERSAFLERLERCMADEQPFRDGALKLEDMAARLAMTAHELSQLINSACGANFQDYLNRYRVAALKAALLDPANGGANVLDLALGCGFNSKSALNRVFKKHTGLTPTEFRSAAPQAQEGDVTPA